MFSLSLKINIYSYLIFLVMLALKLVYLSGLIGGLTSKIRFTILTDISKFENALIDLYDICQGINIKY